jgi:magnesium transporter
VSYPKRKNKFASNRSRKVGLPPGSLVYVGKQTGPEQTRITVIEYDGEHIQEREVATPEALLPLKPPPVVTWINVDGIRDEKLLETFGQLFALNPLLLEDILNTEQRPKCEVTENYLYIILKMFDFAPDKQDIVAEQVSLILGSHLILTFQEEIGDEFDPIRDRLRVGGHRIRTSGAGYLLYNMLDAVVDRYFIVLEKVGQCLEDIEESLLLQMPPDTLQQLHHLKRELIFLRKHLWPVREVITTLQHSDSTLLSDQTQMYLRDIYDHTIQAMDTLETYRDLLGGVQDLYHSTISNRMNEIMKVLTIISTLFIPLTFIVGVYGMNFKYMPELEQQWGYPAVWVMMIVISVAMYFFFKRRHWI